MKGSTEIIPEPSFYTLCPIESYQDGGPGFSSPDAFSSAFPSSGGADFGPSSDSGSSFPGSGSGSSFPGSGSGSPFQNDYLPPRK